MGRLRIISLLILLCGGYDTIFSQRLVVDAKAIELVGKNMGSQMAIETPHNSYLDSIKGKQEDLVFKTGQMAAIAETLKITYRNVSGFKEESAFYKAMAKYALSIASNSSKVISAIGKSNMPGKARMILEVGSIVSASTQLVNDFIGIVTNCNVKNPLQGKSSDTGKAEKDGYNMLNRNDRLSIAISIVSDLKKLDRELLYMQWYAMYSNWSNVVWRIDSDTWRSYYGGKEIAEGIIKNWNRL